MPIEVIRLRNFRITSSDIFFLDNNVWIYLFCPTGDHKADKQEKYSKFFDELLSRKAPIFVTSMLLSEFSHTSLKLDFDIEREKKENHGKYRYFKRDYYYSPRGQYIREQVRIATQKILSLTQRCPDNFTSTNMDSVLSVADHIGFNDSYFLNMSKDKNFKFVTDDGDFGNRINAQALSKILPNTNIKIITD